MRTSRRYFPAPGRAGRSPAQTRKQRKVDTWGQAPTCNYGCRMAWNGARWVCKHDSAFRRRR